jgi:antitoxin (DNA-binding transcriptional repressor) of toxin-antitoxin stability system
MPSVNLRELRNTRQLLTWLEAGEVVELRKRNCVVARIVPESPKAQAVEWPDFAARLKRNFGDRILPGADLLIEEREKSRY